MLSSAAAPQIQFTAALRLRSNFSRIAATTHSRIETMEVTPAKNSEPKNSRPNTVLRPGSVLITCGKTMNASTTPLCATSPTATSLCTARKPSAALPDQRSAGVAPAAGAQGWPWLWLAFAAAFAIKVPMWPFHTRLPDAHTEAPTVGSVIRARSFDRTCRFYGEALALPRLQNWDREDGRGALYQAGSGVVGARSAVAAPAVRDEAAQVADVGRGLGGGHGLGPARAGTGL